MHFFILLKTKIVFFYEVKTKIDINKYSNFFN